MDNSPFLSIKVSQYRIGKDRYESVSCDGFELGNVRVKEGRLFADRRDVDQIIRSNRHFLKMIADSKKR